MNYPSALFLLSLASLSMASCRELNAPGPLPSSTFQYSGLASHYSKPQPVACAGFHYFDPARLTAAHRTLPCGSRVLVHNLSNGKHVTVTITDRGPWIAGREIDLSLAGARALGFDGLERVSIQVIHR